MESHFEGTKFWPPLTFGSHTYWNRWTHGSQNFGRSIGGAIAARTCGELCPWGRVISNNAVWTEALPRQYRHWPIRWTFLQRVTAPVSLGPGCWKAVILCEAQRAEREPGCLGREFSDAMKSTPRSSELINLIKGIPKGLKKLWHGNQGQRVRAKSCRLWEKRSRCHKLFIFIVCAWCIIFFKLYDIWRVSLFHLGIWRDLRLWKRHDDWFLFRESSFYNSKLETSHMLHDLEVRTVLCKIYPNDSADMLRHALPFCWDISHSISISIYHLGPRFGSAFQVYKPYGFRAMHFVLRFLAFLLAYGLGPQRQLATEVWPMKCPPSTTPGIRMASIVDVAKSQHLES